MELASAVISVLTIALLYGIPLAVIVAVVYGAYRSFDSAQRKLPEDLPSDLFDGNLADTETKVKGKAAASEFNESFRARAQAICGSHGTDERIFQYPEAILMQLIAGIT